MKKKNWCRNLEGLLPKSYCGRMDCIAELYCKEGLKAGKIALQYRKLYCSEAPRMGWKCIAIHWFVLQRRGLSCIAGLYCKRLGWGQFVSQYSLVYCGRKAGSKEDCIAIQWIVL